MSKQVRLKITEGPQKGEEMVFDEPDRKIVGRESHCAIRINDEYASRNHCILEINPPLIGLRDLGSLNGTFVNGKKIGGRRVEESPEEAARKPVPEVELHHRDEIRIGETCVLVVIEEGKESIVRCRQCGREMKKDILAGKAGADICPECQQANAMKTVVETCSVFSPDVLKKRYEYVRALKSGGFGIVELYRDRGTGEQVALKRMLPRTAVDEKKRQMFLREVEVGRTVDHPNIVRQIARYCDEGAFYFLMEYCDQGNVRELVDKRGGSLPLPECMDIAFQALEGLAYAHRNNIIHRDIKPENILLKLEKGKLVAKLADLGLAKNFAQAGMEGFTITGTGAFAGTVYFMPPEQLSNYKYVRPPTDVWSIGATIYFMLTGKYTREFPRGQDQYSIVLQNEIVPVRKRRPALPAAIAEVIDRSLAKNPENRYPHAGEMLAQLRKVYRV